MSVRNVGSVAHQTSSRSELQSLIDCWHCVLDRQRGELLEMDAEEGIARNYQPASSQLSQPREDLVEVLFSACVQNMHVDAEGLGRQKHSTRLRLGKLRSSRID